MKKEDADRVNSTFTTFSNQITDLKNEIIRLNKLDAMKTLRIDQLELRINTIMAQNYRGGSTSGN